jgi:hypothetical protein
MVKNEDRVYILIPNGMTFPNPTSSRINEIECKFRYNSSGVDSKDLLLAASVISAYKEIVIHKTQRARNSACSAIQKVIKQ